MRRALTSGYFALTFAQVGISLNVVTSKFLLSSMPMFMLLASRFGLSTLVLWLVLRLTGTSIMDPRHPQGKLTTNDWTLAILLGVFAAFLFNIFFVWGLQHTTATAAGIIGSTLPALIALFSVWLLKERLNSAKIIALALAMLGILVINVDHFEATSVNHTYFGDFLIFIAMFPEAWYSIISRKLANRVTPLGGAFIANVVGFVTLLPCALMAGAMDFSIYSSFEFALIGVAAMSSLIFFWAWAWGLSFIPASTAAIFGGVMPVATTLFAILFLGENLHWYDSVGMLLVLASIIVGAGWRMRVKAPITVDQSSIGN
ncbi:EamA family transporter [Candidatus Berkiella aquae]|uniref:DMT family transporter n=1 Tax=Candidatus Berkiella aquae TaxID=295108 RepID=A0A0Q9YN83_9GAMM|nr:DMT family transporter [Candidatus Berkiella aquae]MCS5712546.1 DMT family transporter [Candidatus Berkiella aquae]